MNVKCCIKNKYGHQCITPFHPSRELPQLLWKFHNCIYSRRAHHRMVRSVCSLQSTGYFPYLLPHLRTNAIWPCLLQNATLSWAFMITVEYRKTPHSLWEGWPFIYIANMAWCTSTNTYTRIMAIHTLIITLSNRITLYNMSAGQTLNIYTCEHRLA
jgi:hypothetical protein